MAEQEPVTIHYDILIIGSGPAGHHAAIQAAKAGKRVAVVDRERQAGGACVHRGTIPSKTLRETALQLSRFRTRARLFNLALREDVQVACLLERLDSTVRSHAQYMEHQLQRNKVARLHGRAKFRTSACVEVTFPGGGQQVVTADNILIATGSRPRAPEEIPVDHEHILDSDSILSMLYLPSSLTVLGGGVIACEYASIFASLGVKVTIIDRQPQPLGFIDPELTQRFLADFERNGGRYLGSTKIDSVAWNNIDAVEIRLADGAELRTDKVLVALGRVPCVDELDLDAAGVKRGARGHLVVDHELRTTVPHIFAAGDVIGPPGLATSSMEQGRRAVRHALGMSIGASAENSPIGIYTIPELSTVGLDEAQAKERFGDDVIIGRAPFEEIARGQISENAGGLLKMVADPEGSRILGVQIVGDGATELIHLGQMALFYQATVETFIENLFNFPTLAEAYRVAALSIVKQRATIKSANWEAVIPAQT